MNFAPFNVLEFDGALPSVTIASWLPTTTQPGRALMYAAGTTLAIVQLVQKVIPRIPDPWRATSALAGAAPKKGVMIRAPSGIVSSPPVFSYVAPPAAPSNTGYTLVPVPDPRRGTSTPLYGPQRPFVIPPFLGWTPTIVQPGRPILRAPGTDHVKDVWRFPEAVSSDKWLSPPPQPSRKVSYAPGTTFATSPAELVFADKWQPTVVQPVRSIIRASGTDSVRVPELVTADKWVPTWIQPTRQISRASGTESVTSFMEIIPLIYGQAVMSSNYSITAASGTWVDSGFSIALPSAGTYMFFANVRAQVELAATDQHDLFISCKLFQDDSSVDVPNSVRFCTYAYAVVQPTIEQVVFQIEAAYSYVVTVVSACNIHLYVMRAGGYTIAPTFSMILSDSSFGTTTMSYIKIA